MIKIKINLKEKKLFFIKLRIIFKLLKILSKILNLKFFSKLINIDKIDGVRKVIKKIKKKPMSVKILKSLETNLRKLNSITINNRFIVK
tara:strand:+ start:3350 stop:3616 length:267 start_codon:yes stop_codon:yes gene_type:complete